MNLTQASLPSKCGLCAGTDSHEDDCPLADASVPGVAVIKMRPGGVVFRMHDARWWWTSCSGMEYHIEKMPDRYQMSDSAANTIVCRPRLSDIRHWIGLNQGKL